MKMIQKTVLSALIASTFFAVPAFAGAFEGFNVQLGGGFNSLTFKGTVNNQSGGEVYSVNYGAPGMFGMLSAGYTYAFAELSKFNLGANLFYMLTSKSIPVESSAGSNYDNSIDIKNTWGISFEPGYYLSDSALGYLKLGYVRTSALLVSNNVTLEDFGSLNGALYGFGVKQFVTDNIFVGFEASQMMFLKKNASGNDGLSVKPTYTQMGINVGYRF
jgi:opacity protein-like surface antigen